MFGLEIIDITVIAIYFAAMVFIGFRAMKRIRNQEDYFLGGRRFGKLIQTFAAFGQGTSADTAVGTTTTTYNNGASGIWGALLFLWSTPIYWFTSPWYRRLRVLTLGDFFEERYGSKRMAGFYAVISSFFLMAIIAIGVKAVSSTVLGITQKEKSQFTQAQWQEHNDAVDLEKLRQLKAQKKLTEQQHQRLRQLEFQKPRKEFSHINENLLICIITAIVFIYAVAGGLEAALYTDMIQGIFIIILSIILIPFGLSKINSVYGTSGSIEAIGEIHRQLPEWYFDVFGSAQTIDFTWYYILAISLMVTINVAVQANQLNAIGSAKDEMTARIGFVSGSFMKRFCTVLWGVFGLIAVALYSGQIENPDYVWGHASRDLLGGLHMGLVGLMIACLLAALMSTADMMMITASGVLTRNLYRSLLPNFTEKHYVKVGRVMGALVLVGGVLLATWFDSILQMLKFVWEINTILAAAFWCGMKWRRANRIGAWSSMTVTLLLYIVIPLMVPLLFPQIRTNSYMLKQTDPKPLTRTYTAREMDVKKQNKEIENWDNLNPQGKAKDHRPTPVTAGQKITKIIQPPRKSVFWSKDIKIKDQTPYGDGLFYVEMLIIDRFCDLSQNPHALNETIRTLIKVFLPLSILIIVSLLTKTDDPKRLDRFFVKMRTPVNVDRKIDRQELENSYANPQRFEENLLFPDSGLEFMKWKKIDTVGFLLAVLAVFGIIAVLQILLHIGA